MAKKTSYHHGDLRRALLDAALLVLSDKDARGLSLREVARRAGVSHTAPYRHFAHKEALLAAVAEEGFIAFGRHLKTALEPWQDDPLQALKATGVAYVRYACQHATHYRVMFGRNVDTCDEYPSLLAASTATFETLVGVMRAGQAQSVIKAGDPKHLALGAWAQVHGLAMLLLDGQLPIRNPEEIATLTEAMIQSSIAGLAPPTHS